MPADQAVIAVIAAIQAPAPVEPPAHQAVTPPPVIKRYAAAAHEGRHSYGETAAAALEVLPASLDPLSQPGLRTLIEQGAQLKIRGRYRRDDDALTRAHIDDCRNMGKAFPGYPQPAFVTLSMQMPL